VLCIGGSDSSGGAGIQADLRAVTACGAFAATAVTALTAQSTTGVAGVHASPADFLALQIDTVARDLQIGATKTGMLGNRAAVEVVSAKVQEHRLHPLVVDPVLAASTGAALLDA